MTALLRWRKSAWKKSGRGGTEWVLRQAGSGAARAGEGRPRAAAFERRPAAWRKAFGAENLILRDYDAPEGGEVAADFLRAIGVPEAVLPGRACAVCIKNIFAAHERRPGRMDIVAHSRAALVAYQDLLRLHLDEQASALVGAIEARRRNGRTYLYERFRIGREMKSRYLGEDRPELRARLERAESLKAEAQARRKRMSRLVRTLRAEGFVTPDRETGSMLLAFSRAGVFRLGGTLVGTFAYGLYQGELGVRMDHEELARTGDIDLASFERLSVALDDRVEESPSDILRSLRFEPVPGLQDRQVWKWRQSRSETMVEFLTPAFGDETVKPLPALGVSAQALNYLNFLIADPIPAVAIYRSGVLVQAPRPERFAIHKLIVADRRGRGPDRLKAAKDRAQAAFLVTVLAEDRPDDLAEAYEDALSRGPRWRARIAASLKRMPETAERLSALV